MVIRRFAFVVVASVAIGALSVNVAGAQTQTQSAPARFLTVDQGGDELRADEILATRLGKQLIRAPEQLSYELVINALLDDVRDTSQARAGGVIARVTPYAFVVAEMRGAKVELLSACKSQVTGKTVTNAYLVVPRSSFPDPATPTLEQVLAHLKKQSDSETPDQFIYHNKYSTSSYFLPSLLFRDRRVFGMGDRASNPAGVTMITVERNASPSSSDLIRTVATQPGGKETFASVWTGPMSNFAEPTSKYYDEFGKHVRFVPLPDDLPCDLIVATRKVSQATRDAIDARLETLKPIGPEAPGSDVENWVPWASTEAEGARRALSDLRRQAGSSTIKVVVDVESKKSSPVNSDLLDAARLAIRLSGTELVDKGQYFDYFKRSDIKWELEGIHEGAVRLTVLYENLFLDGKEVTQEFDVSFLKPADLTRRLVSLIHSRLHRIRPVWLYNDTSPTVLRDVEFDVAKRVPWQELQWYEPQRNDYRPEESQVANIEKEETFEIQLAKAGFPIRADNRGLDFEPMGRQGFRVLLMRETPERTLFRVLTMVFVVLLAAGAAALMWDAWRWRVRQMKAASRASVLSTTGGVALPSGAQVEGR